MVPADTEIVTLSSLVPPSAAGQSLLAYLTARFRYHDRAGWQRVLQQGAVDLDGRRARGHEPLRGGMRLTYRKLHREPPVDANIELLHRDDALVVVAKPAHLPMHADGPFLRNTLIALMRHRLAAPDLQLLHRLDRETSGVAVLAADRAVQASLQPQFADGGITKTYLAVVRGRVDAEFTVDLPIGRCRDSTVRLRRRAAHDAIAPQPAATAFTPVRHGPTATLLACRPRTGRTHQIRAHLEAAGHPVLGDKLYGRSDEHYLAFVHRVKHGGNALDASPDEPNRHLLHASELCLRHPRTGTNVRFAADLPAMFDVWLERAERRDA